MPSTNDLKAMDLQVYGAAWCPDCRRLDRWLAAEGLDLPKVDIEDDPAAAERLEQETGKRGIPYFLVNGKSWVRGYHRELPSRFDSARLIQELTEADSAFEPNCPDCQ